MRASAPRLLACAALVAMLASGLPASAQGDNRTATPGRGATLTIALPRSPADIFLDVSVQAYTPPRQGTVDAVVAAAPAGGEAVDIGHISIYPDLPFAAAEPRQQRSYRFDATALLRRLKPGDKAIVLRVTLIPLNEKFSPQGASLTLGRAAFSPRP